MYMKDFEYDGRKLSELGYMVAYLNNGVQNSISLSAMTINTFRNNETFTNHIASVEYNTPITVTFDICKNPCVLKDELPLTDEEISYFMKWLNRKEYKKFHPIYENDECEDIIYYGSCNLSAIYIAGAVRGFTVTFTANSPFGYTEDRLFKFTNNNKFVYNNTSDEEGYLYPSKFVVKCLSSGDLVISNSLDAKTVVVRNCQAGETLTFDGKNKTIISSANHANLFSDFNYVYPRFVSRNYATCTTLSFNMNVDCDIVVNEVRKVGIFV